MNKKFTTLLIALFLTVNTVFAEYSFVDPSDFTGDAFFTPPAVQLEQEKKESGVPQRTPTMPPVKKARLLIKKKLKL